MYKFQLKYLPEHIAVHEGGCAGSVLVAIREAEQVPHQDHGTTSSLLLLFPTERNSPPRPPTTWSPPHARCARHCTCHWCCHEHARREVELNRVVDPGVHLGWHGSVHGGVHITVHSSVYVRMHSGVSFGVHNGVHSCVHGAHSTALQTRPHRAYTDSAAWVRCCLAARCTANMAAGRALR